jgi:hypothetical protein
MDIKITTSNLIINKIDILGKKDIPCYNIT